MKGVLGPWLQITEAGRGKHSPSHLGRGLGSWPNDMHRGLWALELGHGAFQGGPISSGRWDEAGTRLGTQAWGHSCLPDRWDNNHKSLNPGVSIQYRLNKWSHSSQLLCSDTANEGKGDISEPGWEGLRKGGTEMKTKARAEDSLREGRGDSWSLEGQVLEAPVLPGKRREEAWGHVACSLPSASVTWSGTISHLLASIAMACSRFSAQSRNWKWTLKLCPYHLMLVVSRLLGLFPNASFYISLPKDFLSLLKPTLSHWMEDQKWEN